MDHPDLDEPLLSVMEDALAVVPLAVSALFGYLAPRARTVVAVAFVSAVAAIAITAGGDDSVRPGEDVTGFFVLLYAVALTVACAAGVVVRSVVTMFSQRRRRNTAASDARAR